MTTQILLMLPDELYGEAADVAESQNLHVDSGADATMIPISDLHKIDARKVDARWMYMDWQMY